MRRPRWRKLSGAASTRRCATGTASVRRPRQPVRMLEKTPKNSLRVPFLARVFPEAHFIYLYRDPRQVLSSMIEAWTTGRFRTYPQLPGWTGPPWSLLLVPGWRELIGRPAARDRGGAMERSHAAADRRPRGVAGRAVHDRALRRAGRRSRQREIRRLYAATGLDWDEAEVSLRLSKYTVSPPDADKWRRHSAEIEAVLPSLAEQIARAERFAAR